MKDKDVKFLSGGARLQFDGDGFAINLFGDPNNRNAFFVADWRDIVMGIVGSGQVLIHGSIQRMPPNFKNTSTFGNMHALIGLRDLTVPNTYYAGATGSNVTNDTQLTELNTNLLTWIAIERKSSAVNVKITHTNAQ